jgi:outer membrane protein, multidrug efflux system
MKTNIFLTTIPLGLLLTGCAIGPDYVKPTLSAPKSFRSDINKTSEANKTEIDKKWWLQFGDDGLSKAVEAALESNYDIKVTSAQVEAVLGQFDTAKSYLYPHINAGASYDRKGVRNSSSNNMQNGVTNTYAASLSMVSYEIDLFGKVRRATEAARAMLLSSEYNRRAVNLSVASAVAASYTKISSLSAQIEIAKENIEAAKEIEKITKVKYDLGSFSEIEWLQSVATSESAKATLAQLEASKIAEEAVFNVLLGQNPQAVSVSSLSSIKAPEVPMGLPSEILSRRPDIGMAEQNLIAANAKIGVAKGAYFPSISLTGMLGVQSPELNKLFSSPTRIWQVTPSATLPIFTAGLVAGQVKAAEADKSEALAQYEKAVISAFNDADSAIGQNFYAKEQSEANKKRAEAMKKAFAQAKLRYQVGSIAYSDMLLIQQNWLVAEQQAAISKQAALVSVINLYKALGGGWGDKELPDLPNLLPAGR